MKLELYTMNNYMEKKATFQFTQFIKSKIEEMAENLYLEMKTFYEDKGEKMPSEHFIYLLLEDNKIIGFRHFLLYKEEKNAELFSIAVDPYFQRQGYAKDMINRSIVFLIDKDIKNIKVPLIKSSTGIYILEKYYLNTILPKYNDIKWNIQRG